MSDQPLSAEQRRLRRKLSEIEGFLLLDLPAQALAALRAHEWPGLSYEASVLSGEALRQLGNARDALEHFERAATLRPVSSELAMALGWCYKRTHRLAQAIEVLEAALQVHPEESSLSYNLACYWSLAGNPDKAIERLLRALELDPGLHKLIADEPDFDPVRHQPAFIRLVRGPGSARSVS